MKKKIAIARGILVFSSVLLLLFLFFPVKAQLDDGGSVVYGSIAGVYKVTKIKRYGNVGMTLTMREGLSIELFGKEVYYKIDTEYLAERMDWGDSNGTTYFDAEIVEITEDRVLVESIKEGVGPIRKETPVAFAPVVVDEQTLRGLWIGDEVRIMYNDKRVRVENPLWLEIVFVVYPLDKTGEVISEKGATLHQGFVPSESREGLDESDTWMMYTETPYSSLMLVDGEATAKMLLEKTEEAYPADTPVDEILAAVKEENYVVLEDLRLASGGEVWQEFYQKVQKEEHAQVSLVHYFAPDDEADNPQLYFYSLVYVAGEGFWVMRRSYNEKTEGEAVCQYRYLIHDTKEPVRAGADYSMEDIYFLANDNTVTWDKIQKEALSSYYDGDRTEYYMVYVDFAE